MNQQDSQNDKKDITLNSAGLSLFNGDNYFYYVFKKTQKILSATYLITDFMLDSDPIKTSIRESGIALYKSAAEMSISSSPNRKSVLDKFFSFGLSLISFCNTASHAGLMSVMNYEIMSEEIRLLMQTVENREVPHKLGRSFVISKDLLKTDVSFQGRSESNSAYSENTQNNYQAKESTYSKTSFENSSSKIKNNVNFSKASSSNTAKKSSENDGSRTQKIVDLIKMKGEVSIKDISDSFTDCSEKTIQRELISLVSDGVILKVGERRWSRYSISK